MPRITEDELTRLKQTVSLVDRVRAEGIALTRNRADWIGRCPFHDDTTPSLVITPAKNLWYRLGACQTGGSIIDWVMRYHGLSFRHAVDRLRAEVPLGTHADALKADNVYLASRGRPLRCR